MMKRFSGFFVAFMVSALVLTGCGAPSGEGDGKDGETPAPAAKVIGAAMLTQTHIFYQDMVSAMQVEAEKQGVKLKVQYAEFDSSRQNNQIETFMAQGVDAIIVAPTDSSGVAPVIAEARRQGIAVFTADIAAKEADVLCHVASDNEQAGALVGEYLAQAIDSRGKVAIIDHPSVTSVQERTRGFDRIMERYPQIEIVQRVPGLGQRDKAMLACEDLLQAQPDLDGIFAINDDSALGALAAVESAGLQNKIVIVGVDGTPEARETILAGTALIADAAQFPDRIGAKTIQVVVDYLLRDVTPPAVVPIEVELLTRESLKAE